MRNPEYSGTRPGRNTPSKETPNNQPKPIKVPLTRAEYERFKAWGVIPDDVPSEYHSTPPPPRRELNTPPKDWWE